MIEALLVLLVLAGLAALVLAAALVSAQGIALAGAALAAAGLLLGVPTGVAYHVKLRAALGPRGELPARWWLRPAALHGRLRSDERPAVLLWFAVGGAGFVLTLLGCALATAGVLLEAHRAGLF